MSSLSEKLMLGIVFLTIRVATCSAKVTLPDMNMNQMRRVLAEEEGHKLIATMPKVEKDALPPLEEWECVAKFTALDFRPDNFHKYTKYFRDTSTMILAEAGEYVGAEDIEEYVRFAS